LATVAATDVAGCCRACNKHSRCSAFTYLGTLCFLKTCKGPGAQSQSMSGAASGYRIQSA
jgi:hypothetical protein